MTKRADLLALASRVEQLTGPDREVDAEIALACGVVRERDGDCFYGHEYYSVLVLERGYYDHEGNAPELLHYTSSIDAAMTLVPEGEEWCLSKVMYDNKGTPAACVNLMLPEVLAATPALALTAASLRALAEKEA